MPSARAIAAAVAAWSPVIIMVRMPAAFALAIAAAASGRGGSIMPTKPAKVMPLSSAVKSEGSLSTTLYASEITRSASEAKESCTSVRGFM